LKHRAITCALALTTMTALTSLASPSFGEVESVPESGAISGWGYGGNGELEPPAALVDSPLADVEAAENYTLALSRDGRVSGWGFTFTGLDEIPAALTDGTKRAVAIDVTYYHALAVTSDGRITGWGGTGGDASPPDSVYAGGRRFVDVEAGYASSFGITTDGKVVGWGNSSYPGTPPDSIYEGGKKVVKIESGMSEQIALMSDGTVVTWGQGYWSKIPANLYEGGRKVIDVAATMEGAYALTSDGKVHTWGGVWNPVPAPTGDLYTDSPVVRLDGGNLHVVALRADGTTFAWGQASADALQPQDFAGKSVIDVSAGKSHNFVLYKALVGPAPQVTGVPRVGATLTADVPDLGTVPTYQWIRSSATSPDVVVGTGAEYTPSAQDLGSRLRLEVQATRPGHVGYDKESAATAPVGKGTPVVTVGVGTPLVAGVPGRVAVKVVAGAAAATGTVTARDGQTVLGTARLTGADRGSVQVPVLLKSPGTRRITITYSGSDAIDAATAARDVLVAKTPAAVTLKLAGPMTAGRAGAVSATVRTPTGPATGTIVLKDGGRVVGVGTLSARSKGTTRVPISIMLAGARTLTATYSGTAIVASATASLRTTVSRAPVAINARASALKAKRAGTVTVTLRAASLTPTGRVTVKLGSRVVGTATLTTAQRGTARIRIKRIPRGKRVLTVAYSGDRQVLARTTRLPVRVR
jgi:hypothetical protein